VCVDGELDAGTHLQFEALLARVVDEGKTFVVVDLSEATFLDSTALSGLLACARRLRRPEGALAVVVGRHAQPRARFDLTGTGEVLNVCESREAALSLVAENPGPPPAASVTIELQLFVNGDSPPARRAIRALEELPAQHPHVDAHVEVIDVSGDPARAEAERLLATPALVRRSPPPVRRVIGDLTDHAQVLYALDLAPIREEHW